MARHLIAIVLAVMFVGCATGGADPAKQASVHATVPTCGTPEECELKWAAARRWVLENSGFKLQSVTDDFLETYNPTAHSPSLAARVSKEPLGGGQYRIVVSLWCANMFGCVPDAWDAALAFNNYVNASAPIASRLPEGCDELASLVRVYGGETLRAKCVEKHGVEKCDGCLKGIPTR